MTNGMKNKIINKARSTVRSDLATMVRLAFHDCVGNITNIAVAVVCNTPQELRAATAAST